jgi:hypothetical protein
MTASSATDYVANSKELVGMEVSAAGARILTGVKVALLKDGDARETISWQDPTTIGTRWGYLMDGSLAPGKYQAWAKVTTSQEEVWLDCGVVTLY